MGQGTGDSGTGHWMVDTGSDNGTGDGDRTLDGGQWD